MSTRSYALALGACASLLLTACGGGGGGSTAALPAATSTPIVSAHSSARATATITIPKTQVVQMNAALRKRAASSKRSPNYVSPNTAGVYIIANRSDGYDESSVTAVSATSNGCTTNATNGSVTCIIPFNAPATAAGQTDEIIVQLLDAPDMYQGNLLAIADIAGETVTSGGTNTFSFVCGGVEGQAPLLSTDSNPSDANSSFYVFFTPGTVTNVYPLAFEWSNDQTKTTATEIIGLLDAPMILTINGGLANWYMPDTSGPGYTVTSVKNPSDTLTITDTSLFTGPAGIYPQSASANGTTITVSTSGLNSNNYATSYYGLSGPTAQLTSTYELVDP